MSVAPWTNAQAGILSMHNQYRVKQIICSLFYLFFLKKNKVSVYTLLPIFLYILPRRSSRTSTWLGQPSAWVRFYNEICKSQTFQCTPFFTNRCTICPIYHIFIVAGNFVGVLGVLALQYLKTMPLQSINRLISEAFSYFPSFQEAWQIDNNT